MNQDAKTVLLSCLSYASDTTKIERLAHILSKEWQGIAALTQQQAIAPL